MATMKQSERIRRLERDLADLDKKIEQSRAEMQWVEKHRGKIWTVCLLFWVIVFWFIFK